MYLAESCLLPLFLFKTILPFLLFPHEARNNVNSIQKQKCSFCGGEAVIRRICRAVATQAKCLPFAGANNGGGVKSIEDHTRIQPTTFRRLPCIYEDVVVW